MHSSLRAGSASAPTAVPIASQTSIGTVRLTVADLPRATRFYEQVLGLQALEGEDGRIALTAGGDRVLVELHGDPSAAPRDPRAPGLFHMAILVPDRPALAMALARADSAGRPLTGASDHLVSEALYLADPEGNGIEVYCDRPRDQWPRRDGSLEMATLPLDVGDLLDELEGAPEVEPLAPSETTIGHVHLQVSDLEQAEAFYAGVLGFDVMVRRYPGALFVAAGGYHHHVGLNTWNSAGAEPARPGSVGLRSFDVVLPSLDELEKVLGSVRVAGVEVEDAGGGFLVHDPFGNGILLRST